MGIIQDGGVSTRAKFFPAAKPCDYCNSTAALLFCRVESAFMCVPCDAKVHNANDKHERVWMCEVCEQAPAAFTCKADAAALCLTCDRDIHSANPLASRHERIPAVPFYDTAESVVMKSTSSFLDHERKFDSTQNGSYIPDSWITPTKLDQDSPDLKPMELFFQDSDQFLDFDNYQIPYSDSVVPVQTPPPVKPPVPENRFEIDFSRSNINSYYTTPSLSHSVSSSSMDVGVVPDGGSLSEISHRNMMNPSVVGMDREARVLRYREKRKNRKFEKTIRYASRKAYAETRPRIKGRFAKRTDPDSDIDRIFGPGAANFVADSRFGIVPSF